MTYDDSEQRPPDDAVPVHLPPAEGPRPDWLLDAADDPHKIERDPAAGPPRLVGGPPPPRPPAPPLKLPAPPLVQDVTDDMIRSAEPTAYVPPPKPEPEPEPEVQIPAGPSAWTAAASSVPVVRSRHRRPLELVDEEPAEEETAPPEIREAAEPKPAAAKAPVPHEPFWLIAIDELRTNRRIQIGLVVLAALLFVVARAPWKEQGLRLSKVLANAASMDGQEVLLSGRVGESFPFGAGYAFYLHEGRDSIVVFAKTFRPVKNRKIRVRGSVSTGVLDGVTRAAIFEVPDPANGT